MSFIAKRAIDPSYFSSIPRVKDAINDLPNEIRICMARIEPVVIRESEFLSNPGPVGYFC